MKKNLKNLLPLPYYCLGCKKNHKGDHHDEAKLNLKNRTLSSTHEKGGECNHVGNKLSHKNK
jgi:hypothetical protein